MANPEYAQAQKELENQVYQACPWYPVDLDVGMYSRAQPNFLQPWEYNGWRKENMSWKKTCYISAQLTTNTLVSVKGPDAQKLISDWTINSFANCPVGKAKHTAMTDDDGNIWTHGLILREAEDEFLCFTMAPWIQYRYTLRPYDCEIVDHTAEDFNFQCAGPRSLEMIEKAIGEDFHDLPFMGFRHTTFNGKPVFVFRMGMGGTLAYEIHGNVEDARELYEILYETGKEFGVERLGWLSYTSNHTENGFPQDALHFCTASRLDSNLMNFLFAIGFNPEGWPNTFRFAGSSGQDFSKRTRNPVEVGWGKMISFDHDFPGKDKLQALVEKPERLPKTLIWNVEDIIDIFASMFQKEEEPYKFLDFPQETICLYPNVILFQDDVFDADGNLLGYSSGRIYSEYSREMFSLGILDADWAVDGKEVHILYGEPGTRQKLVRATVAPFPHLDLANNKSYDIDSIPRIG